MDLSSSTLGEGRDIRFMSEGRSQAALEFEFEADHDPVRRGAADGDILRLRAHASPLAKLHFGFRIFRLILRWWREAVAVRIVAATPTDDDIFVLGRLRFARSGGGQIDRSL